MPRVRARLLFVCFEINHGSTAAIPPVQRQRRYAEGMSPRRCAMPDAMI